MWGLGFDVLEGSGNGGGWCTLGGRDYPCSFSEKAKENAKQRQTPPQAERKLESALEIPKP